MRRKELIRLLTTHGFVIKKRGTKHDFFTRDGIIIPVSKSDSSNPRIAGSIRSILRKFQQ
jgi:predicted RNA binding protein YcfA (HicA-like mRNA interferase family)